MVVACCRVEGAALAVASVPNAKKPISHPRHIRKVEGLVVCRLHSSFPYINLIIPLSFPLCCQSRAIRGIGENQILLFGCSVRHAGEYNRVSVYLIFIRKKLYKKNVNTWSRSYCPFWKDREPVRSQKASECKNRGPEPQKTGRNWL